MKAAEILAGGARDMLGEGAMWSQREQALYWVDILGRQLRRFNPQDETVSSWTMPDTIGWIIERSQGGLVAGIGRSIMRVALEPFLLERIADLADEPETNRLNDAKAGPDGSIWAGTMPYGGDEPTGNFYRIGPDGLAHAVDRGYYIPNGPAIAPDGSFLLHTDSALRTIYRFEFSPDGRLGARRPFIEFESDWGIPDGMTFDAQGGLWVACWGASCVVRFHQSGRRDVVIDLPASQITSCTFGGADLDRLFVTSAASGVDEPAGGALFAVRPGYRGLPSRSYHG